MTVIELSGGGLLLHSPVRATPDVRARVESLGEVRHIVCPNLYHHMHAGAWAEAHPEALLHAPPALRSKRPDLRIGAPLEDRAHPQWELDLIPIHIDGCMLDETVLFHTSSRTLVSSDLTENFSRCEHWPTRTYLKAAGVYQKIGWSRPLRLLYRDHARARRSVERLLELDAVRIIIAHGDVIEGDVRQALEQTFQFLRA
jgi:hypothetical protein